MFAVELANDRLSQRHRQRLVALSEMVDPQEAVEVGILDRIVPAEELLETAVAAAEAYTALDPRAHLGTKRNLRGPTLERIRASLDDLGPSGP